MYTSGRYEVDYCVLQYICIGSDKNLEIRHRYRNFLQIDWTEIGEFLINRFKSFPEKNPDGQVHEQWPKFGRDFGKWISLKLRNENPLNISPTIIRYYIKTDELNQLHRGPQLCRTAVKVGSSCTNASVPSQRFQNMDGRAFVGQ